MFSMGYSMTDKIIVQKDGGVGHIRLNQPEKHNAISYEMWQGMARAIDDFESDDAVRVIVLSGEGGRAFSAGADISQFEERRGSADAVEVYNATMGRAYEKLAQVLKPTIAKIAGYCIGGGLLLRCVAICGLRPMIRLLPFPQRSWAWGMDTVRSNRSWVWWVRPMRARFCSRRAGLMRLRHTTWV